VRVEGLDAEEQLDLGANAVRVGGELWSTAERLAIRAMQPPRRSDGRLVLGEVGVGFTIGDGQISASGRVELDVLQGQVDRVRLGVAGLGRDLHVSGAQAGEWERSGDEVIVTLIRPADGSVQLDLSWTLPLAEGEEIGVELAVPELREVFRSEHIITLGRDGEVEVAPRMKGWTLLPTSKLPNYARSLVLGDYAGAYGSSKGRGAALDVYRFQPAEQPATFVDVAQYTLATSEEGRLLGRAHYLIRNDRGAHLRLVPPDGMRVLAARVAGETARLGKDEDEDALLIPLKRSVETLEGLLSFGVEVLLIGEDEAWGRTEQRSIQLPSVSAPVAVSRVQLHLPPGWGAAEEDLDHRVDSFTEGEGITYGLASDDYRVEIADQLFQQAVGAWMDNDFDEAQALIGDIEELGADNENLRRLQSNIDLVQGNAEVSGAAQVAQSRKVREAARARAEEDARKQEDSLKAAEEAYFRGEYEAAEQGYAEAREIGDKLALLADDADRVDEKEKNIELERKLDKAAEGKKKQLDEVAKSGRKAESKPSRQTASTGEVLSKDFLERIPEGRNYQSEVTSTPGVVGGPQDTPEQDLESLTAAVEKLKEEVFESKSELILFEETVIEGRVSKPEVPDVLIISGEDGESPMGGNPNLAGGSHDANEYNLEPMEPQGRVTADRQSRGGRGIGFGFGSAKKPPPPPPPPVVTEHSIQEDNGIALDGANITDGRSQRGATGKMTGAKAKPMAPKDLDLPTIPDPSPEPEPAFQDETSRDMEVTAVALSLLVPTMGERVLYQQLLLPEGATQVLDIAAKQNRRK